MGSSSSTPQATTISTPANAGTVPNNIPLQSQLTGAGQNMLDAAAPYSYYTAAQLLGNQPVMGQVYTQGPNQSIVGNPYGQGQAGSATQAYYGQSSAAPYSGTAAYGTSAGGSGAAPAAQQAQGANAAVGQQQQFSQYHPQQSGGTQAAPAAQSSMGPFDQLISQLLGMGAIHGSSAQQFGGNATSLNQSGQAWGQQPNYGLFGQQTAPKAVSQALHQGGANG